MRRLLLAAAMALMAAVPPAWAGEAAISHKDGFEKGPIDTSYWSLYHMGERRHWIEHRVVRRGKGALAIRIKGSDYDGTCRCQISEIREALDARVPFGTDVWYGFSFRVEGFGGMTGSTRWQITGWKQEADGSPFVAQRFDEGIFHITLESGTSRVLVATAMGDSRRVFRGAQGGAGEDHGLCLRTGEI